jgi:serine/threonine protein kinase
MRANEVCCKSIPNVRIPLLRSEGYPNSFCRYALDIALALHHCHSNKILHLDVKPSNIMVCSEADYCKLCDFGSSHVLGDEEYCTVSPNMVSQLFL